jgi:hypothetical protein
LNEPTEYKYVGALRSYEASSPRHRHPDHNKRATVLEAVKVWPGKGGASRKVRRDGPTLTAPARADMSKALGRGEETSFRSNKETDERKKMPRLAK